MKKINVFRHLVIILITTTAFVSCTEQQTDNSSSNSITDSNEILLQRGQNELNVLRDHYSNVVLKSESYIDYTRNIRGMVNKLNDLSSPPLENRTHFQNWISTELGKTKFRSVSEAMAYYDLTITSFNRCLNEHRAIFSDLDDLSDQEIDYVIKDGYFSPPVVVNANPCQNSCMDGVSAKLDSIVRSSGRSWWQRIMTYNFSYWDQVEAAIDDFNACMANC